MSGTLGLIDAIRAAGYEPPNEIIWDGHLRRFATDARKRHSKDGWYIAFDEPQGRAAAFGSWRNSDKHTWTNGTGRQLTGADWGRIEAQRKAEEQRIKATRQAAANRAANVYAQASVNGQSEYLTRKGINLPAGARFVVDLPAQPLGFERDFRITGLVVPVTNVSGALISLQFIPDNGKKYFLPGGQLGGGFFVIGALNEDAPQVVLVEGLATGQSIIEATELPVVVTFSAGNLPVVAGALRQRYPKTDFLIAGDDDPAGRAKANEAADVTQGRALFPPDGINDFNDLHQARGLSAIKKTLDPGVARNEANPLWRTELITKVREDGVSDILGRLHNLILILEHTPEWHGRLAFNQFTQQITVDDGEWTDAKTFELKAWLEKHWVVGEVKTTLVHEAVEVVANRHVYHPVRDYLYGLTWDGTDRLQDFFPDFCGCPKSPYIAAVGHSLFVSAVARILSPGSKVDTMVVLEGEQGARKSTLVLTLFSAPWHMEIIEPPGSVDFCQSLRGRWCCEFGEMAAFARSERNRIKQALTQIQDTYRASYARNARTNPRQNIFIGTTNQQNWNDDPTGARRFLPVRCVEINVPAVAAIRDQLWAEAVARYRRGEPWHVIPDAGIEQEARFDQDVWEERIAEWLFDRNRDRVTVLEVMEQCLYLRPEKQNRSEQTRIGNILLRLKWVRRQETSGSRKRYYVAPRE